MHYRDTNQLVHMAIDGIRSVFQLQSPTPKNDFCRLFVKCDVLKHLANALLCTIKSPSAQEYADKTADIFLLFSHGDAVVKKHMADPSSGGVLERTCQIAASELEKPANQLTNHLTDCSREIVMFRAMDLLKASSPQLLLKILKTIKQLSMDTNTLAPLQQIGAIPKLINMFGLKGAPLEVSKEIDNQLLGALYNLTRISKERQEQAALAGIIPHLKEFISNNSPLKQFALSSIIELAHVRRARAELWKNQGAEYYLQLLKEEYWKVNALDSLSVWYVCKHESLLASLLTH